MKRKYAHYPFLCFSLAFKTSLHIHRKQQYRSRIAEKSLNYFLKQLRWMVTDHREVVVIF